MTAPVNEPLPPDAACTALATAPNGKTRDTVAAPGTVCSTPTSFILMRAVLGPGCDVTV